MTTSTRTRCVAGALPHDVGGVRSVMNVLVFSTIFPSRVDPIRGLYNLRTVEPLAEICNVRVVCPTSVWKRVLRPRELLFTPADRYAGVEVTYPTYLMIP